MLGIDHRLEGNRKAAPLHIEHTRSPREGGHRLSTIPSLGLGRYDLTSVPLGRNGDCLPEPFSSSSYTGLQPPTSQLEYTPTGKVAPDCDSSSFLANKAKLLISHRPP